MKDPEILRMRKDKNNTFISDYAPNTGCFDLVIFDEKGKPQYSLCTVNLIEGDAVVLKWPPDILSY